MSLVDRAKNILLQPKAEWLAVDAEPATVNSLFTGYAMILALLPVIGSVLGAFVFGSMFGRWGAGMGVGFVIVPVVLGYNHQPGRALRDDHHHRGAAAKLRRREESRRRREARYLFGDADLVIGLFSFIPGLNILLMFAGFIYGAYLLYLGATAVGKVPVAKATGFTAVTIVVWIVLGWIVSLVIVGAVMSAMFGGLMMGGAALSHM